MKAATAKNLQFAGKALGRQHPSSAHRGARATAANGNRTHSLAHWPPAIMQRTKLSAVKLSAALRCYTMRHFNGDSFLHLQRLVLAGSATTHIFMLLLSSGKIQRQDCGQTVGDNVCPQRSLSYRSSPSTSPSTTLTARLLVSPPSCASYATYAPAQQTSDS